MNDFQPFTRVITRKGWGEERFATIEATYHQVPQTGHLWPTYRWIGDAHLPVRIVDAPKHLDNLPWPMRQVGDYEPAGRSAVYIRTDVRGAFWTPPFVALRYLVRVNWEQFTMRAVATAHIWGFADIPMDEIPSWKHIGRKKRGK